MDCGLSMADDYKTTWMMWYVEHIKKMEANRHSWAEREKIHSELRSKWWAYVARTRWNRWW
jgi:hypothetical protein